MTNWQVKDITPAAWVEAPHQPAYRFLTDAEFYRAAFYVGGLAFDG
jgi:hypothetical protein